MNSTSTKMFLFALLIPVAVSAQQDPKAQEILKKLSEFARSSEVIYVRYDYSFKNIQTKESFSANGEAWIKKDKFKILVSQKNAEIYYDGEVMWTYIPSLKEVNISVPDTSSDEFFINNPVELFTYYEKEYKTRYLGDVNGTSDCRIDLYPVDLKKPYYRIRLNINKTTNQLTEAEAAGKNGETYLVKLKEVRSEKNLPDSFFTFDRKKHPEVEVIDLRF